MISPCQTEMSTILILILRVKLNVILQLNKERDPNNNIYSGYKHCQHIKDERSPKV